MKPSLLFTTLTMILATPTGFAKSELETLRSLCAEQERQIRQLEDENSQLRSDTHPAIAPKPQSDLKTSLKTPTVAAVTATDSTYTVKAGDSLDRIARKVGMTPEKLAKANGLKANAIIQPGQKLKVTGSSASATAVAATPPATPPATRQEGKTHKIQQGETFSSISKKYKVSTATLIAANPSVKPSALRPGQVVRIIGSSASTTTISAPAAPRKAVMEQAPTPVARAPEPKPSTPAISAAPPVTAANPPEITPTAQASAPTPVVEKEEITSAPEKKFRSVTIEDQTTYGDFAEKHGTDAERLNALNGLDLTTATVLAKGSELYVPAMP
jgi:LysM repeat protein